jgi:hypothetical protein
MNNVIARRALALSDEAISMFNETSFVIRGLLTALAYGASVGENTLAMT